jgi:hypothetical protein
MRKLLTGIGVAWRAGDLAWKIFSAIIVLTGGSTAAVLAAGSQQFKSAGSLAWFEIGLASALVTSLILYFVRKAQAAGSQAALTAAWALKPSQINPLATSFEDQIVPIAALHLPGKQQHQHKHFRRRKFIGPGAIALIGGNWVRCTYIEAGSVISLPDGTWLSGITVLDHCTAEDCQFYGITLMIPEASVAALRAALPNVHII